MQDLNAWVFPGQGSQFAGMSQGTAARDTFDEASSIVGWDVRAAGAAGAGERVNATEIAQPLILTSSVAATRTLQARGLQPDFVAGHSAGEFAALVAAGALSFPGALRAVVARADAMARCGRAAPGAMAAVLGLAEERVREVCESTGGVVVANVNGPQQIVVSGERAGVERAAEAMRAAGARRVIPLAVSVAAHSPLMTPAAAALDDALSNVSLSAPRTAFISGVTAAFHDDPIQIRRLLVQAVVAPVRWSAVVATLAAAGARTLVETGPGRVLTGLARRIDPELRAAPWDALEPDAAPAGASR